MPNDLDNDKDFPKLALDCGNWAVWREKAEDYIRGLRHYQADTMITAAWWVEPEADDEGDVEDDPADAFLQLPTNTESAKQFKVVHQQAFAYLRRKLCDGLFNKTIINEHEGQDCAGVASAPACHLERRLGHRLGPAQTRNGSMQTRAVRHLHRVRHCARQPVRAAEGGGRQHLLYNDDEDKLHRLMASLDDTWKIHKSTVSANELSYTTAKAFFQKCSKSDPNITGTSIAALRQNPKNGGPRYIPHKNFEAARSSPAGALPRACARVAIAASSHTATPTQDASEVPGKGGRTAAAPLGQVCASVRRARRRSRGPSTGRSAASVSSRARSRAHRHSTRRMPSTHRTSKRRPGGRKE